MVDTQSDLRLTLHFEDDLVEVDVIVRAHPRFPMTP